MFVATGNVQRFGPCDTEEMDLKIYTESNIIKTSHQTITMKHNVSSTLNFGTFLNVSLSLIVSVTVVTSET